MLPDEEAVTGEEEVDGAKKTPPPVPTKPDQRTKEKKLYADNTAENTVQNLLNEAISQMITIRNRKRDTSPDRLPPSLPPAIEDAKVTPAEEVSGLDLSQKEPEVESEAVSGQQQGDVPAKKLRLEGTTEAALDFTFPEPSVITQSSSTSTGGKVSTVYIKVAQVIVKVFPVDLFYLYIALYSSDFAVKTQYLGHDFIIHQLQITT